MPVPEPTVGTRELEHIDWARSESGVLHPNGYRTEQRVEWFSIAQTGFFLKGMGIVNEGNTRDCSPPALDTGKCLSP